MDKKAELVSAIDEAKENLKKPKKSLAEQLRKKYGQNSFKNIFDDDPLEIVETGCLSLDYVSGVGGFPRGMNVVLEGLPSAGKTEIALDWAKEFLLKYKTQKVYFIDVENRLRKDRVLLRGIPLERFDIGRTAKAEKVFDIMCDIIRAKEHGTIIVDSIAMLISSAEFEKDLEDQSKPGTQGKSLNMGFRKLGEVMMEEGSKCINLFINHQMAAFGAKQWEPKTIAKSGFAPKYLSSFTVEVERMMGKERITTDSTGTQVGNDIKLISRKNSLSHIQFRKASFHLNYSTGPVLSSELYNLGTGYGLIERIGRSTYTITTGTDRLDVKGYDNLINVLDNDQEIISSLTERIKEKIKNKELTKDLENESLEEGE